MTGTLDMAAEQQALDACRGGRSAAYRPLVEAYLPRAVRLAIALVGDPEDARDLAQDAFVAAYRAMPKHREGSPFYPWLRGILINRCKVHLRSRRRAEARRRVAAERPGHWAAPRAATAADLKTKDLVRAAMGSLEDDDRSLLVLKHVEGFTYDELAAALGIPRGTVMSRLYRARGRLRARLTELDPGLIEAKPEEDR